MWLYRFSCLVYDNNASVNMKTFHKFVKIAKEKFSSKENILIVVELELYHHLKKFPDTITNCPFKGCQLNSGKGVCVSTNNIQCKEIPWIFDEDK